MLRSVKPCLLEFKPIYVDVYDVFLAHPRKYGIWPFSIVLQKAHVITYYQMYGILIGMFCYIVVVSGFDISNKGCCGTILIQFGPLCNNKTPFNCSSVNYKMIIMPIHTLWFQFIIQSMTCRYYCNFVFECLHYIIYNCFLY